MARRIGRRRNKKCCLKISEDFVGSMGTFGGMLNVGGLRRGLYLR
jgi:hypothetical protein